MAGLRVRSKSITTGALGAGSNSYTWQVYQGAGLLLGAYVNVTSMAAGADYLLYDSADANASATGRTVLNNSTVVTDVDATVAGVTAMMVTDGLDEAGSSAANTSLGLPFKDGLYLTGAQEDDAITTAYSFLIKPLIKLRNSVATVGATGSALGGVVLDGRGPGIIRAVGWDMDPYADVGTDSIDVSLHDGISTSGTLLFRVTNTDANQALIAVTSDGVDEILGSIANIAGTGIAYRSSLYLAITGADAVDRAVDAVVLVEK